MCSSSRSRLALLLLPLLLGTLAACGKRGDPTPAPRRIPQTVSDLIVRQRGFEVALEFGYPKATVAGLPYAGLDEVVLLVLERPAPATGAPVAVDPREFALAARPLIRLVGGELASAISGDRVTVRYRLPDPLPTPVPVSTYAVQTHAAEGESSALSNLVALVPKAAPPPPEGFSATARKTGIELGWRSDALPATAFQVYRRDAEKTSYGAPLATLEAGASSHLDTTAIYGRRYIYTLCAVANREPLIESAPAAEREVDFQDRFAPETPRGVRALASVGEVRLIWEPSPDSDTAGYLVERADPGADFHRVTADPVAGRELVDRGLASGFTFRYRVAAVDAKGNLGNFSLPIDTTVP